MLRSRVVVCGLSAIVYLFSVETASAEFTVDCTYDGYVAMGGMVFNTTNSYLLPSYPDSPPVGTMETFGYAFLKFDDNALPSQIVDEAYLHLDVIALQDGMSWPVTGTGNVGVFSVGEDVLGINGSTAGEYRDSIAVDAADSVSMSSEGVLFLNVTDIVNEWITSGNNTGLVLASPGGLMPRLHSSDSTTGMAPVITNVPEPASLGLLACSVLLQVTRRKHVR